MRHPRNARIDAKGNPLPTKDKKFQGMIEARASIIAIATSVLTMLTTFGFASLLRVTQPAGARTVSVAPSAEVSLTGKAEQGRHLFLMNCAHCHGDDARGDEGPDLHGLRKTDERIHQIVTGGIKGEMPSFAKKLNDSDIQALTTYLRTLHG